MTAASFGLAPSLALRSGTHSAPASKLASSHGTTADDDVGGIPHPAVEDRAVEVQMLLADRGQHRGPAIPDLLVDATAEIANLTVLALDKDFDLIASITGQPLERLRV